MQRIQTFLFAALLLGLTLHVRAQSLNEAQSVLTQRNDVRRTGIFSHETVLTPAVVSGSLFTRLVIRKVDGQIAAQPLYVSGVTIGGIKRNVLYVATRKNRIYALDADNINQNDPHQGVLWSILLQDWDTPGSKQHPLFASPLSGMDDGKFPCQQTHGPVGITGTPVIDPGSQIMYLVARFGPTPSQPGYGVDVYHYLVAVDIRTGQELRRVLIQYNAHAGGFTPSAQLNRPGLLLLNNVIYVAFGTPVCDHAEYYRGVQGPTHGWVFAYSPLPAMHLLDAYNTSPNHGPAGIWQSGSGLAGDPNHNFVYAFTGNSFEDDAIAKEEGPGHDLYARSHSDLPESILKLNLVTGKFQCDPEYNGCVTDHFTAGNWYRLDTGYADSAKTLPRKLQAICEKIKGKGPQCNFVGDSDLGSGGPVVLSNGWVVGGGKQGRLYVLDPGDMKHAKQGFLAAINSYHQGTGPTTCITTDPSQEGNCVISTTLADDDSDAFESWGANIHGNPAVWERPSSGSSFLYLMAEKDYLRAYRILKTGQVVETAEITTATAQPPYPRGFAHGLRSPDNMPGGFISVSSNGDQDGILWVSVSPVRSIETIESGVLMAFDALTLKLLWSDDDPSILFAKYTPITIAGGKVFRATFGDHDDSGACRQANVHNQSCGSIVIYGVSAPVIFPKKRAPRTIR